MEKLILPDKLAICRKCGSVFGTRPDVGKHYKEFPDHKLPKGEYSAMARKKVEEFIEKQNIEKQNSEQGEEQATNGKRRYKRREQGQEPPTIASVVKFCPCCGLDLMRLEQAIKLMQEMQDASDQRQKEKSPDYQKEGY